MNTFPKSRMSKSWILFFTVFFCLACISMNEAASSRVDKQLLRDYQRHQSALKSRIGYTLFTIRTYTYNFRRRDRIIKELPEVEKRCQEKQEWLNRERTRLNELLKEEKEHMKDKGWGARTWSRAFPDYKERFRRKKIDELKRSVKIYEEILKDAVKNRDQLKQQLAASRNYLKRKKEEVVQKGKTFVKDLDKARDELKRIEKDIERIKNGQKPIHTDPSDYARKDRPKKKTHDHSVIPPIVATQSTKEDNKSPKDQAAGQLPKFIDHSNKDNKTQRSQTSKTDQKNKTGKKPGFASKNKSLAKTGGAKTSSKGWKPTGKSKGRTNLQKSADRKDYEIVSTLVKTAPVTYEGRNYQKLINGSSAVIVVRNRGRDSIIEGTQAVTILVEKGFFVHFPKVGLIATTRYDRLGYGGAGGGSGSGSSGDSLLGEKMSECAADNPDNPCPSYQQKCAGVSLTPPPVPKNRRRRGDTGETTEQYWRRVWCKRQKEVCQTWLANGCKFKRNEDFHKGFITTPMSPEDAKVFGGALLPDKK